MSVFATIFALLVGHEGAELDLTRADPGNWTGGRVGTGVLRGSRYGISAAQYPAIDIGALTAAQAQAIYERDYWLPVHGPELPPPLALLVFDASVNNGPEQAVSWLQLALGVTADGQYGPQTARAVAAARGRGAAVCAEFMAQRMLFMSRLPTWRTFGLGWSRRLCALPFQCSEMAEAP